MAAYGLQTHIWNNNLKSGLLLAGFPVLLITLTYGLFLLYAGLSGMGTDAGMQGPFLWAAQEMTHAWPFALIGAGAWFGWGVGLTMLAVGSLALVFNPVLSATAMRAKDRQAAVREEQARRGV